MKLDHDHIARQLDAAYAVTVALDRALTDSGFSSWPSDSPRPHTLAALAALAEARRVLDGLAVGASGEAASLFIRRDLQPTATTRAAARIAIAGTWPFSTDEHRNAERTPRGTLRDIVGPSGTESGTSDEDPGSPLDEGAPLGPAAAAAPASCAIAATDDQRHAETGCTATQPRSASCPTYPDALTTAASRHN